MQSIKNKWFKSANVFVVNHNFSFIIFLLIGFCLMACQKDNKHMVHLKGRIVTKGTDDPILLAGVKFGIYEAQPSDWFLSPQEQLLIDSFETDANGKFDHTFKYTGFLENTSVKQISVVPGYAVNQHRFRLTNNSNQFEKIEQTKKIVFAFTIDNRNGSPFDEFSYIVPGSLMTGFVGNHIATQHYNTISFTPMKLLIADHQLDTQYNIDVIFETLDTARYTFTP